MLKLSGIECELNWLFSATFASGLLVRQTPEDKSAIWSEAQPRSAWFDVAEALRVGEQLTRLTLFSRSTAHYMQVNFPELTFTAYQGLTFRAHEGEPVFNLRPVYCRRRTCLMNGGDGTLFNHSMIYRIGWQGNLKPDDSSTNIQRVLEIPN